MPSRDARVQRGRERARRIRHEIAAVLRSARRSAGIRQATVGLLLGVPQTMVSRLERGVTKCDISLIAPYAAVVGLDLSVRFFPAAPPIRDAAHVALFSRLQALLPPAYEWRSEIPVPIAGDPRAIDAAISRPRINAGFELESRLMDAQALARRSLLKQRDAGFEAMIIVFADTIANRAALRAGAATLLASFPLTSRAILAALRAGQTPAGNGIILA